MNSRHSRFFTILSTGTLLVLLSACSPPAHHVFVVEEIAVLENTVYVRASQDCNFCDDEVLGYVYYASYDQGQNWEEVAAPADAIVQSLEMDQNEQSPICLSADAQTCYRIASSEDVELSRDGGATWAIDWQIPAGRTYYMQRRSPFLFPDTNLLDIQPIESDIGHVVIVAMGNQGVLVKSAHGSWSRIPVGKASLVPFQAAGFSEANEVLLYNEGLVLALIATGFFFVLSISAWSSLYLHADGALGRRLLWACAPFGISFAICLCYFMARLARIRSIIVALDGFQLLILALPLLGLVITWLAIILFVSVRARFGLLAFLATIGLSLLSFYGLLLPFQLWALGGIPFYEWATAIVWVVGIAALFGGILVETKVAPLSVKR